MMKMFVVGNEDGSDAFTEEERNEEASFAHGFDVMHKELQVIRAVERAAKTVDFHKRNAPTLPSHVGAIVILVDERGASECYVSSTSDAYAMAGRLHAAAASLLKIVER